MNISNNSEKQVVFSNVINFMRNDFQNTIEKGYSGGGWSCDICRKSFNSGTDSFNCRLCGWDLCDKCIYQEQNEFKHPYL